MEIIFFKSITLTANDDKHLVDNNCIIIIVS